MPRARRARRAARHPPAAEAGRSRSCPPTAGLLPSSLGGRAQPNTWLTSEVVVSASRTLCSSRALSRQTSVVRVLRDGLLNLQRAICAHACPITSRVGTQPFRTCGIRPEGFVQPVIRDGGRRLPAPVVTCHGQNVRMSAALGTHRESRVPSRKNRWSARAIIGDAALVTSSDLWDAETAERYDETSAFMFAPDVLDPAVRFLADLAGTGAALEFAIGTGRVAIPLVERGVSV